MSRVSTVRMKEIAGRGLPPGHAGREAILALPDQMDPASFDAVFPLVIRLLRAKTGEGGR